MATLRMLKIGLFLTALAVGIATFLVVRAERENLQVLPNYGTITPFQLVDQQGTSFDSQNLLGGVTVVNFIFTTCPSICPRLTEQMAKIQQRTQGWKGVRLLSISVDPENDTPEKLSQYGKKHHADFSNWSFLTGPAATVDQVIVRQFMNALDRKRNEITHGENFVILDEKNNIRAFRRLRTEDETRDFLRLIQQLSPKLSAR